MQYSAKGALTLIQEPWTVSPYKGGLGCACGPPVIDLRGQPPGCVPSGQIGWRGEPQGGTHGTASRNGRRRGLPRTRRFPERGYFSILYRRIGLHAFRMSLPVKNQISLTEKLSQPKILDRHCVVSLKWVNEYNTSPSLHLPFPLSIPLYVFQVWI